MDEKLEVAAGRRWAEVVLRIMKKTQAERGVTAAALAGGALEAAVALALEDLSPVQVGMWLQNCADAVLNKERGTALPAPSGLPN